jgi:ferredoxin--NADP+ reductase
MPHVVTQPCCSDGSCVYSCPVNCIQPAPGSPDFLAAEMLYIDPHACVDCGACVASCPVSAIKPHTRLTEAEKPFLEINADYHRTRRERPFLAPVIPPLQVRRGGEPLRVAIVGSGPAAMYAADEVLTIRGARVDMYERLPAPYGLARAGVAPDHARTRQVSRQFDVIRAQRGFRLHVGVEVGKDISHGQLSEDHHAVIYAVGAATDKRLTIPGSDLPGATSATELVAWYNGHPEQSARTFDLSHPRAVIIGNGNVALDVARMLTIDPDSLARSDIAPAALRALRDSRIEEVVVIGRRGPEDSAFTLPELVGLSATRGVDILIAPEELAHATNTSQKLELLRGLPATGTNKRSIVLRYRRLARRVLGDGRVEAIELAAPDASIETLATGLVLSSIGYRGLPVPGLPFDESSGTVPNERGRVIDPGSGRPVIGVFVTGWIKRGPSGLIGTNRSCAQETVRALVGDYNAGLLRGPAQAAVPHPRVAQVSGRR